MKLCTKWCDISDQNRFRTINTIKAIVKNCKISLKLIEWSINKPDQANNDTDWLLEEDRPDLIKKKVKKFENWYLIASNCIIYPWGYIQDDTSKLVIMLLSTHTVTLMTIEASNIYNRVLKIKNVNMLSSIISTKLNQPNINVKPILKTQSNNKQYQHDIWSEYIRSYKC